MKVKSVATEDELNEAFGVREQVFVKEQGVPLENEMDEYDAHCEHILIYDGKTPVGAGRLRLVDGMAKLERVCVLASHRKLGLGRLIVNALENKAKEKGLPQAKLHGQLYAEMFYEKLGYERVSADVFIEEGIPHISMMKKL